MLEPSEAWKAASTKRAILSKPIVDLNTGVKSILCMSCSSFKSKVDKIWSAVVAKPVQLRDPRIERSPHILCVEIKLQGLEEKNLIFKISH